MGQACSTNGKIREMRTSFGQKKLKGRHHSEDLGVDGRIILQWILEK
jgi:hypothetical protein